jgi:prevent-host-death family protein
MSARKVTWAKRDPASPRPTLRAVRCYPLNVARARLGELVRRVERSGTRVAVASQGRPVAVLVTPADLAGLEETAAVLSSPDTMVELRRAQAEVAAGRVLAAHELRRPRQH